jgi:hypothetical protein
MAHAVPEDSGVSAVNPRLHSKLGNVEELTDGWVIKVGSKATEVVVPFDLQSLGCKVMEDEIW